MDAKQILDQAGITRLDRGVYSIKGETGEYIVDLCDNNGIGGCNCKDFLHRRLPRLMRSPPILSDEFRCKHIKKVRNAVLDALIAMEIEKESNGKQVRKSRR